MVKGWVFHYFLTCFELVYRIEMKYILGMNSTIVVVLLQPQQGTKS